MKIGICDDQKELRAELREKLETHSFLDCTMEITEYESALELLEQKTSLDLLFLDIEMPEMSGIELLRTHGTLFAKTKVVFLTSYTDYLPEGYEVNAYRYLIKPVRLDKLQELFTTISKEFVLHNKFSFTANGIDIHIPYEDIIYFRAENNVTVIATLKQQHKIYQSLTEIEPLLPTPYFYRSHRTFIVNMNYVTGLTPQKDSILLSNGEEAYLSGRRRKEFELKYMEMNL